MLAPDATDPESPVGKLAYWDFVILTAGVARHVRRCGEIFAFDDHTGAVAVHTLKHLDPHCPPEQDGRRLALFPGAWSLKP